MTQSNPYIEGKEIEGKEKEIEGKEEEPTSRLSRPMVLPSSFSCHDSEYESTSAVRRKGKARPHRIEVQMDDADYASLKELKETEGFTTFSAVVRKALQTFFVIAVKYGNEFDLVLVERKPKRGRKRREVHLALT